MCCVEINFCLLPLYDGVSMSATLPLNLKDLRQSGWKSRSVKVEVRENLLRMLSEGEELFQGL